MQLFNVVSRLIVPMFMHEFVNNYVANYYFLDKAFSESEKRKIVKKLNSQNHMNSKLAHKWLYFDFSHSTDYMLCCRHATLSAGSKLRRREPAQ